MLCQNCGKNEANIRYTQIVNGVKKEMALCSDCAANLGIENMNLTMGFGNLLGDFFNDFIQTSHVPELSVGKTKCKKCGMSLEEFVKTGKFGCEQCYDIFKNPLDSLLKNMNGTNIHIGRGPNGVAPKLDISDELLKKKDDEKLAKEGKDTKEDKKAKLEKEMKQAISEERYEDAAKLRDQLKEVDG